jgi:hypothetical protein
MLQPPSNPCAYSRYLQCVCADALSGSPNLRNTCARQFGLFVRLTNVRPCNSVHTPANADSTLSTFCVGNGRGVRSTLRDAVVRDVGELAFATIRCQTPRLLQLIGVAVSLLLFWHVACVTCVRVCAFVHFRLIDTTATGASPSTTIGTTASTAVQAFPQALGPRQQPQVGRHLIPLFAASTALRIVSPSLDAAQQSPATPPGD